MIETERKRTAYTSYKPSGIDWFGDIPSHWEVRKAKYLLRPVDVRSDEGKEELLTVSESDGVVPRASKAVTMFMAESYAGYKLCWPGDLVINSLWAWHGGLGVSKHHGIISSAYGVYRSSDNSLDPNYLNYAIRSIVYDKEFRVRSKGIWVSRLQLTDESFLGMPLVLPPLDEQQAIADYLDRKVAQITRFIESRRRMIALLEEKKQAIINQAVTKGLDPSVPMKDSGIEWLGEIPAHWEVRKFKQVALLAYGDSLPSESRNAGIVPVFGSNGIVGHHDSANTNGPVIVVGRKGSYGKLNWSEVPVFAIDTTYYVDAGWTKHNLKWLFYSASTLGLDENSKDSAVPGLSRDDAYGTWIAVPPIEEQQSIADQIDLFSMHISRQSSRIQREIELIHEFRSRLIADVVTGKVRVS